MYTRELSAYNLFCRDLLWNKGNLKDIKLKWSSLGEAEKNKYLEESAALKDEFDVLYSFIDEPTGDKSGVPRALKRRAIDALHLKTRAAEEKLLLQREMDTLIHHLHQQHEHLHSAINDTTDPGSKAVLLHSIILLERKLYNAMIMFTNHITVVAPPPNVYLPEFTSVSQSVISADMHIFLCDDSSHDKEDEADENDVDDDDEVDDCN